MTKVQLYDWRGTIRRNLLMLQVMGLWPKGEHAYQMDLYGLYSFIVVGSFVFLHISTMAISVYFLRDDLRAAVAVIYILLMSLLAICKTVFVIKNMKNLKGRVRDISRDWFQPRNLKQTILIQPSIKFWKANFNMLQVMCVGCNLFWAIYPIVDSAGVRRLPFPARYPFDYKISPFYEVAYVFQVVSTIYLTWLHINVDFLINGFYVITACQFDILSDNLRNIAAASFDARKELMQCVIHHKQILSFAAGCHQIYKWILVFIVIMTGLCVGMTLLQSTYVVPFSNEFYSLIMYGTAITLQIFIYCWFGHEVEVKSNLVSYAAFESNWTDWPQELKKDLLFFTMNIIQPMKISAFNIFNLSLDTFMAIMKASWSYFMLMHQL